MTKNLFFLALLLLGACNRDQPPAPTAAQSAALNEAEEMLNDMADNGAANEEGPEAKAPDPSTNKN